MTAAARRAGYLGRVTRTQLDAADPGTVDNWDAELAAAFERIRCHAAQLAARS